MASSTVSHEKALHDYFIPYLNLRKTYGNFGKSSIISVNFRKLQKRFKPVFDELKRFMKLLENFGNGSKVILRCTFEPFPMFSNSFVNRLSFGFPKILRKTSEVFGNLRKFSENFENGSKVIFRCFYDFLKFSENLWKSSDIFGNLRKFSENFGNGSKVIFRCFVDFFKFSENLWKSSEIFGKLPEVIGNFCEEFRSWLLISPQMDPSINCCAQVMTRR